MSARNKSLRFLCNCITPNSLPGDISRLRHQITSNTVDWNIVIEMANMYLVVPALWVGLREKGLTELQDEELKDYLQECHRLNLERNQFLKQLLYDVISVLNQKGIEPIIFKGGVGFFEALFPDLGTRIMTDVDILIQKTDLQTTLDVLFDLGYQHDREEYKTFGQLANLYIPGKFSNSLELHVDLSKPNCPDILPVEELWQHSTIKKENGLIYRFLSPTHQILNHIIHSEVQHENYNKGLIDIRQLHDFVFKINHLDDKIDWNTVNERNKQFALEKVLKSYLYFSKRLMKIKTPDDGKVVFSLYLHYFRVMFYIGYPRTSALIRLIYGFFYNMSGSRICQHYGCKNTIWAINYWRIRRLFEHAKKFASIKELVSLWRYHSRF